MIEDIKKQNKWIQEDINKEWSDVLLYQRLWAERERCASVNDRNQLCNDSRPRLDRPHCSIIKEPGDCRIGNEFDWPMILGRVVVAAVTKTSGCRAEFLAAGSFPSNVEHRTLYINIFPQFTWQIRTSTFSWIILYCGPFLQFFYFSIRLPILLQLSSQMSPPLFSMSDLLLLWVSVET